MMGRPRIDPLVKSKRRADYIRKYHGLPEATRPEPENRKCECCGSLSKRRLHLDHDHETGKFRGWICHKCNMGIALLGDQIVGVKRAISYLKAKK